MQWSHQLADRRMQVLLMTGPERCGTQPARAVRASDHPRWQKQWRIERARGQRRTAGPGPAQAHVQELVSGYGVSVRAIADAAGTSPAIVSELNRGVSTGMRTATEKRILAIQAKDIFNRPNSRGSVPNVGARRRLQALMVMGWRHQDLAPILGFRTTNLNHQAGVWITKQKHDAVKDLYDRIWNVNGPAGAQSLSRVAKAGYAPPLAWDDETIDDPNAAPDLGARIYGQGQAPEGALKYSHAIIEDTEFLLEDGCTWPELLARLKTTEDALERLLHRAGRGDLIRRAKTMNERLAFARAS